MYRLVSDQLHLLHIRFSVFSQVVFIDKDVDDFGNDVIAILCLVNLTKYATFQCHREIGEHGCVHVFGRYGCLSCLRYLPWIILCTDGPYKV